uniref:Uncharacterized protein n=1 Tax=Magnetococcus massalia (strain MO-1) TaxID=451514 RepID=A0A1S7LID1_MAGMO|nr:protein of unknown function [Candidatus Magnetococcus massalia]
MNRLSGLTIAVSGLMLTGMVSLPVAAPSLQSQFLPTGDKQVTAEDLPTRLRQAELPFVMPKARVDQRDLQGKTDLMWAAEHGHARLAEELLDAGANPYSTNWWGQSALDLARRNGHLEVVALIRRNATLKPY